MICFILNREKCSTVPTAFLLHNISKGMKTGKQRMLALNCRKVLSYCDKCSSFLQVRKSPTMLWDLSQLITYSCMLVLYSHGYTRWEFWYRTSSLRSMSPRSGRDIDHWLRQSSYMITFKTVLRICCRISGCSSSTCRNMSLGVGTPLRVFFPVKITVRYLKKTSIIQIQLCTNT